MLELKTVLCPVDFSPLGERAAALAGEICRSFGARLVLHHNLAAVSPGLSMGWMWNQVHGGEQLTESEAETRLRALLAAVPRGVAAEARMSDGQVAGSLLFLQEQAGADLVVLATHGASSEGHASLAERLLEGLRCPVLVVHEGDGTGTAPLPWPQAGADRLGVLVPVDWSRGAQAALRYACDLARLLPVSLHLLHVVERRRGAEPAAADLESARTRLVGLVPPDLAERSEVRLSVGEPEEEVAAAASRLAASWIVMGTQSPGFLHRLFAHDTAHGLLHRAPCPVWYVPAG